MSSFATFVISASAPLLGILFGAFVRFRGELKLPKMNFVVFVLTCITGACLTVHELHWGLDTGLVVVRCHYAASIFSGCHQETSSLAEHPFIYWFHYALYYAIAFATSAGLVAAIRVAHKLKDLRR